METYIGTAPLYDLKYLQFYTDVWRCKIDRSKTLNILTLFCLLDSCLITFIQKLSKQK